MTRPGPPILQHLKTEQACRGTERREAGLRFAAKGADHLGWARVPRSDGVRKAKMIGGSDGGTPEVMEDDTTGFLVQHGEVGQLATLQRTLFAGPALARESRARGRQRVEKE
jgi:hypothetical protein